MKPKVTYHYLNLPLARLHYLKCGSGPPMIMVPATISEVKNWLDLAQFLGQKYTVHFFELPGHGKSGAFKTRFRSDLVAKTVEDFIDALGYDKVTLMGFSFGGILTLKTLQRIHHRVKDVVLIAPCVTHRALLHKRWQIGFIRALAILMKPRFSQKVMIALMHNRVAVGSVLWLLSKVGNVEIEDRRSYAGLKKKLMAIPASTLDVLVYQINEILNADFSAIRKPFGNRLFFAMSVNDPLLDFRTTKAELQRVFSHVIAEEFDFHYHQPPVPFTFEQLNRDFGRFLDLI